MLLRPLLELNPFLSFGYVHRGLDSALSRCITDFFVQLRQRLPDHAHLLSHIYRGCRENQLAQIQNIHFNMLPIMLFA